MEAKSKRRSLWLPRLAIVVMFFINGAGMGNWVVRIPDIKDKIGMNEFELGRALFGVSFGVIIGLLLAGYLISRFGSRTVTVVTAIGLSVALPFVALAATQITLVMTLFVAGLFISVMDMAMNAQAVEVERRWHAPIMPSFHAAYSIGSFAGAIIGAFFVALDATLFTQFTVVAVVFVLLALAFARYLVSVDGERKQKNDVPTPIIQLPQRALWGLGAIVFVIGLGEGSIADWSALYLRDIVGTSEEFAGLGFAAFALAMTVGRLAGDSLANRFTLVRLVRVGGIIATLGLAVVLIFPSAWISLAGFAAVGLGLSYIIPLAFSAAGNMPDIPSGTGLAGVATIGYGAFLVGPPVIGLVAEITSLRIALVIVTVLIATVIFSARAIDRAEV